MSSTHVKATSETCRRAVIFFMYASGAANKSAASVQKRRSRRRPLPPSATTDLGTESPITIKYDVATPKHLIATATSIRMPEPGIACSATELKVAGRPA